MTRLEQLRARGAGLTTADLSYLLDEVARLRAALVAAGKGMDAIFDGGPMSVAVLAVDLGIVRGAIAEALKENPNA